MSYFITFHFINTGNSFLPNKKVCVKDLMAKNNYYSYIVLTLTR